MAVPRRSTHQLVTIKAKQPVRWIPKRAVTRDFRSLSWFFTQQVASSQFLRCAKEIVDRAFVFTAPVAPSLHGAAEHSL